MIDINDKHLCCGCGACVQRCPRQCITLHEDEEGFLYPLVDSSMCIDCGLCEKVCPIINQAEPRKPLHVYAAINPDEVIRMKSSSGGVFSIIAERVIEDKGVVFGARFNKDWEVVHDYTETKEGLAAFRGSKYVQSRIGETYKQVERFLKGGRKVLFSGTPCQVAGLHLFLRNCYENLLTVDVVCHGVPSPFIWKEYLKQQCRKHHANTAQIKNVNFRDKKNGWNNYCVTLLGDEFLISENHSKNLFMRGYIDNLYLRPSCLQCPAKCFKSKSDITLGDFWGIESIDQDFFDNKGTSILIVNNEKGEQIIRSLNPGKLLAREQGIDILNRFIMLGTSAVEHLESIRFWKLYRKNSDYKIIARFVPDRSSLLYRLEHKIGTYIKHLYK